MMSYTGYFVLGSSSTQTQCINARPECVIVKSYPSSALWSCICSSTTFSSFLCCALAASSLALSSRALSSARADTGAGVGELVASACPFSFCRRAFREATSSLENVFWKMSETQQLIRTNYQTEESFVATAYPLQRTLLVTGCLGLLTLFTGEPSDPCSTTPFESLWVGVLAGACMQTSQT